MSRFKKDKLDPTFTYITLSELEVQEALGRYARDKLGWEERVTLDAVRFDFGSNTATVGLKKSPPPKETK